MDLKWYMNNPCKVIRRINEEFSEIEVSPKFVDDISGSNWCDACMVGGFNGVYPTHTCEPYQEVIDYVNNTPVKMLVVAENRLLQDSPVEFAAYKKVREDIKTLSKQSGDLSEKISSQKHALREYEGLIKDYNMQHDTAVMQLLSVQEQVRRAERKIDKLKEKRHALKQEVSEYEQYLALKEKFKE